MSPLLQIYDKLLLRHPVAALFVVVLVTAFFGYQSRYFELDASAESLLLEDDQDLAYFREISKRYATEEFLVATFTPRTPLFSPDSLSILTLLRDELRALDSVSSITSILDVPLLANPPVPLLKVKNNFKSLEHPQTDQELAREELSQSPIYRNLLLNLDANTTALQINFPVDHVHQQLIEQRQALRDQDASARRINEMNTRIKAHNAERARKRHQNILAVREIMERYRDYGELHLGGVPMIADDMISFVKKDLAFFGIGVVVFMILILAFIFRQTRWVYLPMLCCFTVLVMMTGLLGWVHWEVTVVSSNFISLLLIVTLSLSIHIAVRYREFHALEPEAEQRHLVRNTVSRIFIPCLYTALTTMVGFASLVFSEIRPVINFGWMMTSGIALALITTFLLLPALLMVLGKGPTSPQGKAYNPVTSLLSTWTLRLGNKILIAAVLLSMLSLWGISRLQVENSFINYFSQSTEIYQGMRWIDDHLGGTAPLSVLIDFPHVELEDPADEEDDFGFGEEESTEESAQYWFTPHKITRVKAAHRYLDSLPETGKTLSLASLMAVIEPLNRDQPLSYIELVALYRTLPEDFKKRLLTPFVSVENNQVRISLRIIDSDPSLKRAAFLKRIRHDLVHRLNFSPERVNIAGMMVLYNNLLQSLFNSLIMSLGAVFIGIMLMFLLLFRSFNLAVIAICPNLLAAAIVLGVMGWFQIPLDIMTITIAAISIGIAVDQAIHYIYRFRLEFARDRDYAGAMVRSHGSIGKAIFYTSLTIILGFSILALSNFIPTIYFGLLTGLAMSIALLAALTLLPQLIIFFKPLGPEGNKDA